MTRSLHVMVVKKISWLATTYVLRYQESILRHILWCRLRKTSCNFAPKQVVQDTIELNVTLIWHRKYASTLD